MLLQKSDSFITPLAVSWSAFSRCIISILCVLLPAAAYPLLPESQRFEWLSILLMSVVGFYSLCHYHMYYRNPLGVFSPLYMFLLPYMIYFLVFPIFVLVGEYTLIDNLEFYLRRVMLYLLCGLVAFVAGFFIALRKGRRSVLASNIIGSGPGRNIEACINAKRAFFVAAFTGLVTLALCLLLIFMAGGFQRILANYSVVYSEFFTKQNYLISVTIGFAIVNLSAHLALVAHRRKGGLLFLFNMAAILGLMFFQGSRSSIIALIVVVLVLYQVFVSRIHFVLLFTMFVLLVFFIAGAFFYRDFSDAPISLWDIVYNAFIVVNDEMTQVLTLVEGMPEQFDYQYGKSFLQVFFMPIPRLFWDGKPELISVVIKDVFFPHYWDLGLSWPPSIIGELYANFHAFGILVGMFLFGFLSGRLQIFVLRNMDFYWMTIYGATLFLVFREVRGDFATVTSIYLMQIAVFIMLGRLAFPLRRRLAHV